ncbi:hypothetical protein [Clostridium botulinum]
MDCYSKECNGKDCIKCNKVATKKELMTCTCGNTKNEIYAELVGFKITKIFIKCPKCKKESLIAYMDGDLRDI